MNTGKTATVRVEPVNGIACHLHTSALPELWGRVENFAKEVLVWIFTNTHYLKAITFIPEYNRPAIQLAKRCGMKEEGCITQSFLKDWKLRDQFIYGFTKKEFFKFINKEG